ncbi:MAG: methyltransferase domain-containing protein [Bryobacteraceae bacterium]|nr:methyltransferase domain-containing protein [Bryobacteraceae bacterium]
MGQGRNSIYLAQQGWDVTGVDASDEGVRLAKLEAARLGLQLTAVVKTFEEFDLGEDQWDLIVILYEPTRLLAPRVARALKHGGAVVVEDRHVDSKRVWPAGAFFENNELVSFFPTLRVLRYEDVWARPDWTVKSLDARLVRLLAEKPLPRKSGCLWEGKDVPAGASTCWGVLTFRCQLDGWVFTREKCTAGSGSH